MNSNSHTYHSFYHATTNMPTKCIALLLHDAVCGLTTPETLVLQILLTQPNTHAVVPRPTPFTLYHSILPFTWLPALQSGCHHTLFIWTVWLLLKTGEYGSLQCTSTCSWRGLIQYTSIEPRAWWPDMVMWKKNTEAHKWSSICIRVHNRRRVQWKSS